MPAGIDRRALVARHDVRRERLDPTEPLSVGNGEFAFTVDVTGVQSMPEFHAAGMPLHTQAQWAWHSEPNPQRYELADSFQQYATVDGRTVPYLTTGEPGGNGRHERAADWLRRNPHRIDLGRLGFEHPDGTALEVDQLDEIAQHLELWTGTLHSAFTYQGRSVRVTTACHPQLDLIAVRVTGEAVRLRALDLVLRFPYASGDWFETADWSAAAADRHRTEVERRGNRADLRRVLDADVHHAALSWSPGWTLRQADQHRLVLSGSGPLEVLLAFAPEALPVTLPTVRQTLTETGRDWQRFWESGGAIELADSDDERAPELERRTVLSQYLTRIHCSGSLPPAETGLVTNSWRGKFHLEMHWWHAAHFALWGRAELLAKSLRWYERILPVAREYAAVQGYRGARWPKQVGPEGRESPSDVGAFLIWQQPHPIFYAELMRRAGDTELLDRLAPLVFETAEFMASYPVEVAGGYQLGPPLTSAQEKAFGQRTESYDPTFELAYWAWGLRTAQRWRRWCGLEPVSRWSEVADRLAPLPVRQGRYVELRHPPTRPEGHPTMLGALGFVPDIGVVDHDTMRRTLRSVLDAWEPAETWGWDYPLIAMTATRLAEPEMAVRGLLLSNPTNRWLANGHNLQSLPRLPLYLPGNGGLLYAVAMMAAGFEGAEHLRPGFPDHGWRVAYEGITPAP